MGVRFHKSIRLLPFLHLNFSKSGISFSLGAPGAALNLGPKGARGSVGIPGTGLSYRKTLPGVPGTGLSYGKTLGERGKSGGNAGGVILSLILLATLFAAGVYVYSMLQQ